MELERRKKFSVNHSEAYNIYFIRLLRYNVHMVKNSNFTRLHGCLLVYTSMEAPSRLRYRTCPYHPKISRCHFPTLPPPQKESGYIMISITVLPFLKLHSKGIICIFYTWLLSFNMMFMKLHPYCSIYQLFNLSFVDRQLGCLQFGSITHKNVNKIFITVFWIKKIVHFS